MAARVILTDLGRKSYADSLALQQREFNALLDAKASKEGLKDASQCAAEASKDEPQDTSKGVAVGERRAGTIFMVEHPAVYTLGRNGHDENLLVGEAGIRASGAEFYRTDRGGDITFHGEGQIVVYPVIDLEMTGMGLREYITSLEQAVIDTMALYGITCCRSAGASGVWIEGGACGVKCGGEKEPSARSAEQKLRKICAIGVRSSRYVVMHGLALNVATDLRRFSLINPCGFADRGVTSMLEELGYAPDMQEVKSRLAERLAARLGVFVDNR